MTNQTESTETTANDDLAGQNERLVINPDDYIGDFIDKKCPKCGATLLGNKAKEEWCSFVDCDFGCEDAYKELGL